jgi:hypothetical protein
MKKESCFFMLFLLLAGAGFTQTMTVIDSDANILMEVNDEGKVGSITLPAGSAPSTTANKLYNVSGSLYWNGGELGMASSAGGWTKYHEFVHLNESSDLVGIGTKDPEFKLSLDDDGGIIAKGVEDEGRVLATSGSGTRFIWYPRRAALRAGYALEDAWDDANIGDNSVATGWSCKAKGNSSVAMGSYCDAEAQASIALGYDCRCYGVESFATGHQSFSYGKFSAAVGLYSRANSYCDMAIGRYNLAGSGTADSWVSTDPLFEIGNGADASTRANAVTVLKNGNVGIGSATPLYLLEMEASGGGYYNATTHSWAAGSTRAIKQDIRPNSMDLQEVLDQVSVVNYRYRSEVAENPDAPYHIGFIADDTPRLLSGMKHDGMQMTDCIGLLLAVVKEQQKEIESLKATVEGLAGER